MSRSMRLAIRPFGVLGTRLTASGAVKKFGQAPAPGFPIVDPAGLPFIRNGPRGAGGASGEIYRWLGIADEESFPTPVRKAITAPLQAALHYYGLHGCIHVVGPDLNGRGCSREEALAQLTAAYGAVLRTFAGARLGGLRLLPISGACCSLGAPLPLQHRSPPTHARNVRAGGLFAGPFAPELPDLTCVRDISETLP